MAQQRSQKTEDTAPRHIIDETKRSNGVGGVLKMSQDVVETIAGLAAREIEGVHSMGRSRLIGFGDNPKRGVQAEVGEQEAALDLELIIEHGHDIRQVAQKLRERVANEVERTAGRKVVEVNLDVVGVHMPDGEQPIEQVEAPRVR